MYFTEESLKVLEILEHSPFILMQGKNNGRSKKFTWQMSLLSHSPSSLKGPGAQKRYPRTRGKPVSLQSSKRARRGSQGITGWSASPQSQER